MNLGLTLALPSIRPAFAALVALMVACPGFAMGAATRTDKMDDAVLLARDAFRTGNSVALARAVPLVRGHFLEPYVEYWQLRTRR